MPSGNYPLHEPMLTQIYVSNSPYTVETPYSTIPYTTKFHITRWTHGPQNLQRPIRTLIVLSVIWIPNHRVILWIIARDTDSEWTHMCQRLSQYMASQIYNKLTFWPWKKMDSILQRTFSNVFSWMTIILFRLKFQSFPEGQIKDLIDTQRTTHHIPTPPPTTQKTYTINQI